MIKNFIKNPYLAIFFDAILIFFLSIFIYLTRPINTSEVVFVPKGGVGEIISYLSNRNFNLSSIDKYALIFIGSPQSGWINMQSTKLSRIDFLRKLTVAKAALKDITLIPGETTVIFLNQISKELGLNEQILNAEYNAISPLPDGFIMPNTYKIPLGISERHLAYYLVNSSKKAHQDLSMKIFGEYDEKKWFKFLIIASVIQKEAASNDEMPLVSSVIYNRLKKGMRLQMDGTLNYGIYSHETITPERIRTDMSKFNTYLNDGLPPSPVSSVSINAIKAAISPASSDYLYFVRDKRTKKHKFSKTLTEHNQNIGR
ncbi:endolytic transglycosylase MltG [Campylobacter sp. RM9328]|uniref:endolytic transglycosylase MltG n=1 Tax=Campylobacter sp. RM9328 TaxID=1705720 RepID=UPI00147291C6|nr:endolytic transglycosylase MltG [Campylobacter sp. RM9328]